MTWELRPFAGTALEVVDPDETVHDHALAVRLVPARSEQRSPSGRKVLAEARPAHAEVGGNFGPRQVDSAALRREASRLLYAADRLDELAPPDGRLFL